MFKRQTEIVHRPSSGVVHHMSLEIVHRPFCILLAACVLIFAAGALFCLSSCKLIPKSEQIAATVNGVQISEDDVSSYIEGFRAQNIDYETNDGWANFLVQAGYTAEGLRQYVLDEVFIPQILVRQECQKRNIAVIDKDLNKVINAEKAYYEGRYGKDSWNSVLASYGYDSELWKDNEEDRMLTEKLLDDVVSLDSISDEQLQTYANENARALNGRHSFYISFQNEQLAKSAYDALISQTGGALTLETFSNFASQTVVQNNSLVSKETLQNEQNSQATNNSQAANSSHEELLLQDAGWSSLKKNRDKMSNDYTSALQGLTSGSLSEPFKDGDVYKLVFCDQLFEIGKDAEVVSLTDFPAQLLEQLKTDALQAAREDEFESWLRNIMAQSQIEIYEMPSGLAYDVDISLS